MLYEYKKGVLIIRIESDKWLDEIDLILKKDNFMFILLNFNYKNNIRRKDINKIKMIYQKQLLIKKNLNIISKSIILRSLFNKIIISDEYIYLKEITV
ncbi:MAG: hypothetical protein PHQ64_04035 [Bacilli bacterium]|nr:hypothetical protein [Bacilli bacterium]